MDRERDILWRVSNWYFSKKVLPYWVILLTDALVVFLSCLFTYWVANKSQATYDHHIELLSAAAFYAVLSWIGARCFRTYSGVLRYSSFVDLLRVVYANGVNLAIAVVCAFIFKWQQVDYLNTLTPLHLIMAYILATALMWAMRVLVKLLFDAANASSSALRTMIYGALSGGVGLAKNVRSQRPVKFDIRCFLSHENRIKKLKLLGLKVYNLDDNLEEVIDKERIQAVLISPYRLKDFRANQKMQDIFISKGVKIFIVHNATESAILNGEIQEDVQLKEVSVEDLLPRQEIRVDMKSVEEQLSGKKVLITGSAGSIGMEIVRQVAASSPASTVTSFTGLTASRRTG